MSQYQGPTSVESQPTNGWAIAGFVCSIVGLFSGGILAPIGLILSLVALGKPGGRGFAIAGIIIGALGLCGWIVAFVVAGFSILALLGLAAAVMVLQAEAFQVSGDMEHIADQVREYERSNGELPDDLSGLAMDESMLLDPWKNSYRYELVEDQPGFDIMSDGTDGQPDTEDDIYYSKLDEYWAGAWKDLAQPEPEAATEDADADEGGSDDEAPGDDADASGGDDE